MCSFLPRTRDPKWGSEHRSSIIWKPCLVVADTAPTRLPILRSIFPSLVNNILELLTWNNNSQPPLGESNPPFLGHDACLGLGGADSQLNHFNFTNMEETGIITSLFRRHRATVAFIFIHPFFVCVCGLNLPKEIHFKFPGPLFSWWLT